MTMQNPTLGGATMTQGALPIASPPPSVIPAVPSIYALVAPYFSRVIGAAATGVLKLVHRIETRPAPNKPPVTTLKAEEIVVGYVTGPRPVRSGDGTVTGVSRITCFIAPENVSTVPEVDTQVEFDGDLYVVTRVKRLPLTGPCVAWRIEAERGR